MNTSPLDTDPAAETPSPAAEDPLAAARALLAQAEQARMETCAAEIQAVLAKHGMRLEVTPAQITLTPEA